MTSLSRVSKRRERNDTAYGVLFMDDRVGVTHAVGANSKSLFHELRICVLAVTNTPVTFRQSRKCGQSEGVVGSLHWRGRENPGVRDMRPPRTVNSRSTAPNDFARGLQFHNRTKITQTR